MAARHLFQDCTGSGIWSNIIYFCQKNQVTETTTLCMVHLHQCFVGKTQNGVLSHLLADALTFPRGRRPRHEPCSSWILLFIFTLWSDRNSNLLLDRAAIRDPRWLTTKRVPVARPRPGRAARARGGRRRVAVPITTNLRYHNFM